LNYNHPVRREQRDYRRRQFDARLSAVRPIDLLVRGWEPVEGGYWRRQGKEFPEHMALAIERNHWQKIIWGPDGAEN